MHSWTISSLRFRLELGYFKWKLQSSVAKGDPDIHT